MENASNHKNTLYILWNISSAFIEQFMMPHLHPLVISWAQLNMPTRAFLSSMRESVMITEVYVMIRSK